MTLLLPVLLAAGLSAATSVASNAVASSAVATPAAPGPLAQSLIGWVAETCGAAEVELLWLGMADDWTAPGDAIHWAGRPCRERPSLQLTVVRDGQVLTRRSAKPGLAIHVEVPLAAEDTASGERVRTVIGRALIQELVGEPVGQGEWRARGRLAAGEPVTMSRVEPMPDMLGGAAVTLVVHRSTLTVRAPGRLLEDAHIGRPVRVVNDATKVALEGILTAPGTVEIP